MQIIISLVFPFTCSRVHLACVQHTELTVNVSQSAIKNKQMRHVFQITSAMSHVLIGKCSIRNKAKVGMSKLDMVFTLLPYLIPSIVKFRLIVEF